MKELKTIMTTMKMNRSKKLIRKTLSGKANLKEMEELSELSFMERRMKAQWQQCDTAQTTQTDTRLEEKLWQQIETGSRKAKKIRMTGQRTRWYRWMAAACAAFMAIGTAVWLKTATGEPPADQWSEIVALTDRQVVLPDGSEVWMEEGSRLRYVEKVFIGDRRVWLDGEAVFDVKKRPESTFKVYLDEPYMIEVKGTAFRAVNRTQKPLEVDLFRGEVEFVASACGQKATLKPHQHLLFAPQKAELKVEDMEPIHWENGRYHFVDMGMDKLARAIGHIYHTRILLAEGVACGELFNGSIRMDESLEDVLHKLCYNLGVKYKQVEDGYLLY